MFKIQQICIQLYNFRGTCKLHQNSNKEDRHGRQPCSNDRDKRWRPMAIDEDMERRGRWISTSLFLGLRPISHQCGRQAGKAGFVAELGITCHGRA